MTRLFLKSALAGLLAAAFSAAVPAQDSYPLKAIKLVVGYPPGGSADVTARLIGERLGRVLGQPVIIDNKAGAAQILAAEFVAKAPADGYTLLFGSSSLALNPFLYKQLRYDVAADFAPIGVVVTLPLLVSVNPQLPAKDMKALVQLLKARPGKYNYGTSGNGSLGHLSIENFKQRTGIFLTHIPFKGSAAMLNALMAGDIDLTFDALSSGLPLHKAGKVRALAVTGRQRFALAPEIPTLAEAGFPGFELYGWYGLLAPSHTPPDIVGKLNLALQKVLALPEVVQSLAASGNDITPGTPQQFQALIQRDLATYGAEVKRIGVTLD